MVLSYEIVGIHPILPSSSTAILKPFGFLLSPNLFERLSTLVVRFFFQLDQVNTWPEYNHLFWGQHMFIANMGFLSLLVAIPDVYRADSASLSLSHPVPV